MREGEKLKEELQGQLLEYQECRKAAKKLGEIVSFDNYCRNQIKMKCDTKYKRSHDPSVLVAAYMAAVGRGKKNLLPPSDEAFSVIVRRKIVSVSSRIIGVMRILWGGKPVRYSTLFDDSESKSQMVATFLAVLELIKGKRVRVEGDGEEAQIQMLQRR